VCALGEVVEEALGGRGLGDVLAGWVCALGEVVEEALGGGDVMDLRAFVDLRDVLDCRLSRAAGWARRGGPGWEVVEKALRGREIVSGRWIAYTIEEAERRGKVRG
jgi:hypothetical protein